MTAPSASLAGRVAVVTGALGLLGRAHCRALAGAGATVVVTDLDGVACAAFAGGLSGAVGLPLDVTSPASVTALRDLLLGRFDRIDVLVNNAAINDKVEGATGATRLEDYPLELWRRSLEVNVTGAFLCSQILGGAMAARGRGSIVNVASTYGLVAPDPSLYRRPDGTQAFHKSPVYPTGKAALLGLTRHCAAYWGAAGVRVNALSPGGVENGQEPWFVESYARRTPLGRMAAPGDLAGALVFLAGDASAYVTGANLVVDGGFTTW
jgi:NAD(P)-dependent dehydrogenase (short-subunit alcohol dehydrogenase family)